MSLEMCAKQPDTFAIQDERSQRIRPIHSLKVPLMRFSQVIWKKGWQMDNPGAIFLINWPATVLSFDLVFICSHKKHKTRVSIIATLDSLPGHACLMLLLLLQMLNRLWLNLYFQKLEMSNLWWSHFFFNYSNYSRQSPVAILPTQTNWSRKWEIYPKQSFKFFSTSFGQRRLKELLIFLCPFLKLFWVLNLNFKLLRLLPLAWRVLLQVEFSLCPAFTFSAKRLQQKNFHVHLEALNMGQSSEQKWTAFSETNWLECLKKRNLKFSLILQVV